MKTIFSAALVYIALITGALAGPIYEFDVTSMGGGTTSVSGFIEFNGSGFSWADVVAASFKVNGMEGLSSFVGGPACNPFPTNCITFTFIPNGRAADGNIFANTEFTTLRLGGSGLNWNGSFNSDFHCFSDADPCTFTGYWTLSIVPEPSSVALFGSGLLIMGFLLYRGRRKAR
jgi:PEP-CTERM motif